ncbi:MAG: HAD-IIIA family hydrolase, partial [candidate division Zixibacteria bacterium]
SADLTIVNDSGISHLSSAVGTDVLTLFGPTHPALGFAPRSLFDQVMQVDEDCRPCSLHGAKRCFREERYCFRRITSEMIAQKASSMLQLLTERRPALFVDRDGTIIVEKRYLSDPEQVELIDGAASALKRVGELGYKIVIVSNQSGVARGYYGIEDVELVNHRMLDLLTAAGVEVDGVYYCPCHPEGVVDQFAREDFSRKPGGGMAEQGALELNIDLRRSVVVGDSQVDLDLARVIGAGSFLVKTGYGKKTAEALHADARQRVTIIENLAEIADHLKAI